MGLDVWQWPQQDAVDNAEDGRRGANAECEREDGDDGEGPLPEQRAHGDLEILSQTIHEGRASAKAVPVPCRGNGGFSRVSGTSTANPVRRVRSRDSTVRRWPQMKSAADWRR